MKIFLGIAGCLFACASGTALACDFKQVPFGITAKQTVDRYKLNVLDIRSEGEFIVPDHGQKLCLDLPKQSIAEFIFINNVFVQLRIDTENVSGELKTLATESLGKSDDHDRPQAANPKSDLALWNGNNDFSVIYSAFHRGRQDIEMLEITSKKHQRLFDAAVEEEHKE